MKCVAGRHASVYGYKSSASGEIIESCTDRKLCWASKKNEMTQRSLYLESYANLMIILYAKIVI